MNSKTKGVLILGLVIVATMASFSLFTVSAADQTRDQDRERGEYCTPDCGCDLVKEQARDRTQDQSQDRDCLQGCSCDCVKDQTQLQTRLQTRDC